MRREDEQRAMGVVEGEAKRLMTQETSVLLRLFSISSTMRYPPSLERLDRVLDQARADEGAGREHRLRRVPAHGAHLLARELQVVHVGVVVPDRNSTLGSNTRTTGGGERLPLELPVGTRGPGSSPMTVREMLTPSPSARTRSSCSAPLAVPRAAQLAQGDEGVEVREQRLRQSPRAGSPRASPRRTSPP